MKELVKYNEACKALSDAKNTDEVKKIRDKSIAISAYAKQAKNKSLEIDATEIRIRAERRLGEMLKEQKETIGLNKGGNLKTLKNVSTSNVKEPVDNIPTLSDIGIDKKLSSRAQKIASISEKDFEKKIKLWRDEIEIEKERISVDIFKIDNTNIRNNEKEIELENIEKHLRECPKCGYKFI